MSEASTTAAVTSFDGAAEEAPDSPQIGLTGRRPGDLFDDREVGGNLIACQPRSQVFEECRHLHRLAQFHHGDGGLAESVIVSADDGSAPHRRMALQRGAHVVGHYLEAAADDRLIGAAKDPEEVVGVDARHVGGAHPVGARSELARLDLEQSGLSGSSGVPSSSTTRSWAPRLARPTLPRLTCQYFW